jgi:hypothetical protein
MERSGRTLTMCLWRRVTPDVIDGRFVQAIADKDTRALKRC